MAPPTPVFPVSELESRIKQQTVNFKPRARKMRNLDLETCELLELVQYSCTTLKQQAERQLADPEGRGARMECRPFVRLFRRCGQGNKTFHVETTAWEGEHAYGDLPSSSPSATVKARELQRGPQSDRKPEEQFPTYGSHFCSKS